VRWQIWTAYAGMLAVAVLVFAWVGAGGELLQAPPPAPGQPTFGSGAASGRVEALPHVLLALAVVILAARLVGAVFRRLHQPPVIGEMLAGILIGPSLLGRLLPGVSEFLLPASTAPLLSIIAQIGVVLFMFLVGLELDTGPLRQRAQATVAVSHASITAPFLLGGLLALFLYPRLATSDVPFLPFALFMAVSMSVTAFPVLARILADCGLQKTPLGVIALTCAAVGDITAWCLLAVVVGVAKATPGEALATTALAIAFTAAMLLVVRPFVARWALRQGPAAAGSSQSLAAVCVGLLLSALATEAIGIHALFGAFLFGAMIPHDSALARAVAAKLEDAVVVLFLPAFFAFTGLRTEIFLVEGLHEWLLCGLVIAVAVAGKFGGSYVAARLTGLGSRDAAALGVLMNTRGLMELVVLNIGLDLRIISPKVFAMMVAMALVTTFATTPVLHLLGVVQPGRSPVAAKPAQ
jgi:Kef-type K+ transport system membrane component KefB